MSIREEGGMAMGGGRNQGCLARSNGRHTYMHDMGVDKAGATCISEGQFLTLQPALSAQRALQAQRLYSSVWSHVGMRHYCQVSITSSAASFRLYTGNGDLLPAFIQKDTQCFGPPFASQVQRLL